MSEGLLKCGWAEHPVRIAAVSGSVRGPRTGDPEVALVFSSVV
jgi:hypothetical protein